MIKLGKKLVAANRDGGADDQGTRKAKDRVPEGEGFYAPREPVGGSQQPESEGTEQSS